MALSISNEPTRLNHKIDVAEHAHFCRDKRDMAKVLKCAELVDFIKLKDSSEYGGETCQLYKHLFDFKERIPWERLSHAIDLHASESIPSLLAKGYNSKVRGLLAMKGDHVAGLTFFKNVPNIDSFISVLMYIGVADNKYMRETYGVSEDLRGLGIGNAFHALVKKFCVTDSSIAGFGGKAIGLLADSEFVGQSMDKDRIKYTQTRLKIHASLGMFPVLLDCGSGMLINPTIQPSLISDFKPLLMHLMFKSYDLKMPKPPCELDIDTIRRLVRGYCMSYDSVDSEAQNINEAVQEMDRRLSAAKKAVVLKPPEVPDICQLARMDPMLKEQVERDFGSLEEHEKRVRDALA